VILQWLWYLLLAFLPLWVVVSAIIAWFRPWRKFTGRHWWFGWVLIFAWWGVLGWMLATLIRERFDVDDDDG
jgi:hypothetical protein